MLFINEPKAIEIKPKKTEEDVLVLLIFCCNFIISHNKTPFKTDNNKYGEVEILMA